MQKKAFSFVLTLLLAFMGVARADVVTIGEGTSTGYVTPFNSLWGYSCVEQIYTANEIGTAGTINSISFNLSSGSQTNQVEVFMKNVTRSTFSSTSDYEALTASDMVYSGTVTFNAGWTTITLDTPFAYDGSSNLLIAMHEFTSGYSTINFYYTSAANTVVTFHSDSVNPDPYNLGSFSGSSYTSSNRANIQIDITSGSPMQAGLHVKYMDGEDEIVDALNLGVRPLNAWMEPFEFSMYSEGADYNVTVLDFTPSDGMFTVSGQELPFQVLAGEEVELTMATNATVPGTIERQFVAITEGDRAAHVWPIVVEMYDPQRPDVWEKAQDVTSYPYSHVPSTMTTLHNDYTLPFPEIEEGYDAVYKLVFTQDRMLNASVSNGQNGKVALYKEGFEGQGGPMATNNYTGPQTATAEGISYGPVITNAAVEAGTYYLVASSTTPDFQVTIDAQAMPCPTVEGFAFNPTPADNADGLEPASVTLQWTLPAYTTEWRLVFGTTYYPEAGHPQTIITDWSSELANSYTVTNLWNNTNYFWRIEMRNDGCPQGVSSPIWGFTTNLNRPHDLTAVDQNIFEDEQVVLNWTAVVDRTFRTYNVYRDGQLIGTTQVNNIGNATYTDGPLAYNMNGYTYHVTAVYDEGESAFSNDVVVKVSGYSNATGINGYVWEQDGETGIQGALVTITSTDEFGDPHTYTVTSGANGYYSKQIHAGTVSNAVATLDGYQETVTVHALPFTVAHNAQEDNVNFLMDENFNPVCSVIAEYYPDSLDPNSPYVKVSWGCGLPGEEIIEPFETGDFSQFDWQIDANYPWSITTTNPYEGQYCMKSGGAGVASVTSNMTVTVDIPSDGEMSFFGKISSEQNWDYGYFYIDGQQMGQYTGAGNWAERKFPITEGTHTFQWRYTKDGSVNANDDCFYVDYISFYHQPAPVEPGWVFYDDGVNVDAIGLTAGGSFYWGVLFPAGQYAGNSLTKVSMYDYSAHTGNIMVYQGGATAPGTLLYQQPYTCTGSEDFVEWTMNTPVAINPTQNLWIVMNNNDGQYVASCCANTGDPNGRWISIDGTAWQDLVDAGLDYTFMLRAYVANGAKGEYIASVNNWDAASQMVKKAAPVKGESRTSLFAVSGNTTKHNVGVPTRNGNTRSLDHYRIYRTNCYNDGPYTEENTVLLATNWPGDTIYIDVEWADLPAGIYKWGVGCVYAGNRGELVESPISWGAPQAINHVNGDRTGLAKHSIALMPGAQANQNAKAIGQALRGATAYGMNIFDGLALPVGYLSFDVDNINGASVINSLAAVGGSAYDAATGHLFVSDIDNSLLYELDPATGTILNQVETTYGLMTIAMDPTTGILYGEDDYGYLMTVDPATGETTDIDVMGAAMTSISFDGNGQLYGLAVGAPTAFYSINKTTATETLVGNLNHDSNYAQSFAIDPVNGKMYWAQCLNPDDTHFYEVDMTTLALTELAANIGEVTGLVIPAYTEPGPGPEPTPGSNINELALPRESETIWSNCLEKGMYLGEDMVDINVLLNSADSPEGVSVSFTNLDENEQAEHPMDAIVLDETGFYSWDLFRKGDYIVNINFEGYYPIVDTVSIWEETHMRYVMTEIIYGVENLYVSRTGWAMWEGLLEPGTGDRHLEYFKVMCESLDHEPIFNADVPASQPFCQVNTAELVEGEHYLCKVAAVYSTGMSEWAECIWQYESCENYAGTLNGVTVDGNVISWDYPNGSGPQPPVPPFPGDDAEIVLNVPTDIWGDGSGYQMLLDYDATMYTQLAAVSYFDELGSFEGFEYTIPENADYGFNPANVVVGTSVTITVPAGTYDYAIINPDKVSTIWFAGAGNVESKGDDMVYEGGKRYTYTVSASGTGDAVDLTVTDRNGRTYQPTFQHVATGQVVRHSDNIASSREGQWYYYDNGNNMDAIGLSSGTANFSWGIMFPAGSYTSGNLTKVGYYDYTAHTGNIHIYQGGTGNSTPGAEVYTQPYAVNGTETYIEIALTAPVAVDATQALWVVMESTTPGYTAAIDDSGVSTADGCLVSSDGVSYSPINVASGGSIVGNWNLRAYIEDGAPVPPIPAGNVLGAMIFADGEWEAFVEYPTNSYVYEGDAENVCVRMVYDGTAELPDNNFYYAMSCEECEAALMCESDIMIHGEALTTTDQARVWWGERAEGWITYLPEEYTPAGALALGDPNGGGLPFYGGCMYPAEMLSEYIGSNLDQIAYLDLADPQTAGNLQVHIYLGGDTAPETWMTSQSFTVTGSEYGMQTLNLEHPIHINGDQNLWVMFYSDPAQQGAPLPLIEGINEPNCRWVGIMGSWMDLAAMGANYSFVQMIHFGGNKSAGLTLNDGIAVNPGTGVNISDINVNVINVNAGSLHTNVMYDFAPVQYNVYRSADNTSYELIASVPYVEGQTYYEYVDTPETSDDYYYQVRTVYEDGCESTPALNADDETQNYVLVAVNVGIGENSDNVALFPNPTNGNMTIQAAGMSHITVTSVLGQVVYDTDVNADEKVLNMGQFNAGMYMVRINTENGVVVKRVTVM